ncbi:MAG: TraK domain-containing protein, partial [Dictyoglomus turgidum]
MKVVKSLIILVSVLLFISHGVAQEKQKAQLWQTTANTALKAEPTSSSETVSYLKQGTIVEEIKQNKEWIKVKTPSGQIGWISKALVQPATDERLSTCKGVETFSALCPIEIKDTQKKAEELKVTSPFSQSIKGLPTQKPGKPQDSKVLTEDISKVKPVEGSEGSVAGEKEQEQTKEQTKGVTKSGAFITTAPEFSAESFAGSSYVVEPEMVTAVKMSSSDVNRIVCPVDIKDVVYSEEKGIQVKISGKNAFVKFLIKKLAGKEIYSNIPADLYVVCGDNVFSIIAFPERIPSVTVYLEDKKGKIKEILEKKQMPLEKEIVEYVKAFILGKPPVEAEGKPV